MPAWNSPRFSTVCNVDSACAPIATSHRPSASTIVRIGAVMRTSRSRSGHQQSAIHLDYLPGDIAAHGLGAEPQHGADTFVIGADAAKRDLGPQRVEHLGR